MRKPADAVSEADSVTVNDASSSPHVPSASSPQDAVQPSLAASLQRDTAQSTEVTRSHSNAGSHDTVEKARDGRGHHTSTENAAEAGEERQDEKDYSYSSYYSYDSDDEEEDEDSDALNSSHGGSPAPGSPPPQEDLLHFLSFTLEDAALKDHRFMTIEAFRQVLLIGTNQGAVAVVDAATGRLKDLLFNHREPISDVDCTVNELYVASSDKAGYVSVQSRRDAKDVWISQLGIPIESVALHPLYHRLDSCPMVCGGGTKVLLLTKGMLWSNSRRVTTLQENRGRIHRVRWCHRASIEIVAWLSDQEITLYDIKNENVVRRVALPDDMAQNALYPPTLRWERASPTAGGGNDSVSEGGSSSAVLLCGWGDMVQEIRVASRTSRTNESGATAANISSALQIPTTAAFLAAPFQQRTSVTRENAAASSTKSSSPPSVAAATAAALAPAPTRSSTPYLIELHTATPLRPGRTPFPYRVCGIAPYGPQRYVVLASIVDPHAEGVMKDLEVRVVERSSLLDVYRGRMPVRFIHPLQLRLTYLDPTPSQSAAANAAISSGPAVSLDPLWPSLLTQFFILSVDAIVKATPADVDDHVEFLLRSGQFEKAYAYAALHARQIRRHVLQQVGHQWLLHLFESRGEDPRAILRIIELLPELVPDYDSLAWEQWIYRLDTCGDSWRLVALLPGRGAASAVYNVDDATTAAAAALAPASPLQPAAAKTVQVPIKREYYDLVLLRCLRHDANLFYAALHKFDTLFTVSVVLKATEVAYREHCSSHAWWAVDEDEKESEKEGGELEAAGAAAAVDGASPVSPPTSPSAKIAKKETCGNSDGTSTAVMNRTARWSLAASYSYLLRCAGRFEEAMQILMHLPSSPRSDKELFGLIRGEQLFRKTLQLLPELLQRREHGTLELLMQHVAPPSSRHATLHQLMPDDAAAASPSPPPSPISPVQHLELSQYGSAEDPLNAEAVVERLESSDRLHLLRYLDLVKEVHPKSFTAVAKRHAQLVATLYIDYDRPSLLPFLKQMSMYLERIRELHALCHKNNFVEEEIFLLFRMGREEEALRILIEKMHDIHRALEFVVSIPDREEQAALFVRLVDYTVSYNASLPCRHKRHDDEDNEDVEDGYDAAVASGGIRYVLHLTQPGETYAIIAQAYHVSVDDLRKANGTSTPDTRAGSVSPPPKSSPRGVYALPDGGAIGGFPVKSAATATAPSPPSRCVVPLNLFGSFLNALADPQFSEHPALDVRLVLKRLPSDEPIPHAGASIAAIAHTMAEETGFLSTVSEVGERDLMGYYARLLKRRTAAIVIGHGASRNDSQERKKATNTHRGRNTAAKAAASSAAPVAAKNPSVGAVHRCAACHQLVTQQVVVFGCQHMYHPRCVSQYMKESAHDAGLPRESPTTPEEAEEALRKRAAYCRSCRQQTGEQN
ncbi:putative vacuolar assembly protein vps41 [Leptomonas pyrrhocoris]|uniref:Putative vacuolar assembly protein vps41 n=1 Tax=Leptomonas pyrrhocoris TaxID=157538 RepID=A0A0N0DXM3_LEPPY|nr:putative vacuolar assembly protein vps41 [Leptomonas pyrrhocoris]KPA83148.1 putative vacuolar assembly protein vps41 [Leptomonas pyrrhocoris]|eukprot:XP_015661587.1 putative vacuolar assembly protein vps41 [Leptomonas pyrrhocoris]